MKGCRPLSDNEIKQIRQFLLSYKSRHRKRNRALFELGLSTGMRISELLSLDKKDVSRIIGGKIEAFEEVYLKKKNTKKKLEGRCCSTNKICREAIRKYLQQLLNKGQYVAEDPLFISQKGGRLQTRQAWNILHEIYDGCGLTGKLGTHSMRKTLARVTYEITDKDIIATQNSLGHRNLSSTASYLSFNKKEVFDKIMRKLET